MYECMNMIDSNEAQLAGYGWMRAWLDMVGKFSWKMWLEDTAGKELARKAWRGNMASRWWQSDLGEMHG